MSHSAAPRRSGTTRQTAVIIGLVALAVALALAIWQMVAGGDDDAPTPSSSGTVAATSSETPGATDGEAGALPAPTGTYTADPELVDMARLDPEDPTALGPVDAPVTMLIYSDYMCPYCAQFSLDTLPDLEPLTEQGILRIEWRDFAVYGQDAVNAATAAQAAGNQGKFWEMHDWLYENQQPQGSGNVTEEFVTAGAETLGIDMEQFAADFADPDEVIYNSLVEDGQEVLGFAAPSTPTFLINGVLVVGAQPTEVFLDTISWAYQQEQ